MYRTACGPNRIPCTVETTSEYTYPKQGYRIERATEIDSNEPLQIDRTIIGEFDRYGSLTRSRKFAGRDTALVNLEESIAQTFVGDENGRFITNYVERRYDRGVGRNFLVIEWFGRLNPEVVRVSDPQASFARACSLVVDADIIRVEAPAGAQISLADVTGRVLWHGRAALEAPEGQLLTVELPLPSSNGVYVVTAQASDRGCGRTVGLVR